MIREPKIVKRYQTTDGEVFEKKMDAWSHEKKCNKVDRANKMLQEGDSVGFILDKLNCHCPDPILHHVISHSPLCIEHWQCSDKAGYQVKKFNINMNVYVHGDVGSWSGEYGDWITLEELAIYAKHRNSKL